MSRNGIDRPHVRDRRILKRAYHVGQRVYVAQVADVGALLESFLSDCPHIDILDRRVGQFLWVIKRSQPIQAFVWHLGYADVSFTRICIGLIGMMRLGENPEKRCFAYLRQANDASLHSELRRD